MSGLVESAIAIMQMAARRLDIVAGNVANVATPGYKRQIGFADHVARREPSELPAIALRTEMAQAKLQATGNALDLAINGDGFFAVRAAGGETLYTRQGQFHRNADGALATAQGHVLQQAGGGDVVVERGDVSVQADGTIIEDGRPVTRIGLWKAADGAALTAAGGSFFTGGTMEEASASLRSGMVEGSNVDLGAEMTASMLALREAESGARLVQLYDDLMGRALTTFGQGGR